MDEKVLIFSTGAKGGVGKSTLAILMVEALLEGKNTVACLEETSIPHRLPPKYGSSSEVRVANVGLSSLTDEAGMELLGKTVGSLDAQYVIVNTPANGVRIFDEFPLVLASLGREPRATWSLAINADRIMNGAEDDGLFTSMDSGMLSAIDSGHVTAIRPLFQCSYRGQPFWYDSRADVAEHLGIRTMNIAKFPASTLEAIHRTPSSISELVAQFDPILSATLSLKWHHVKTALAATVLKGAQIALAEPAQSLPKREKVFGAGGIVQQLGDGKAKGGKVSTIDQTGGE
ncbi:MAG: hypothetical protein ACYDHP_09505 [Ferrimicrobium sp.]